MSRVERTVILCGDVEQTWEGVIAGDWLGDHARLDLRRGGDGWVRDGHELRHLVVEDGVTYERLVFRWWPLGQDGVGAASRVELDVEEADDRQTRMVVVETLIAPATPLPTAGPVALATI